MKIISNSLLLFLTILINSGSLYSQNPIIRGYADPAMKVHDGKMYMAIGKDDAIGNKGFISSYYEFIGGIS